jgi:hypothetical protein
MGPSSSGGTWLDLDFTFEAATTKVRVTTMLFELAVVRLTVVVDVGASDFLIFRESEGW